MIYKSLTYKSLVVLMLTFFAFSSGAQADIAKGKTIFKNYCGSCHDKKMVRASTGPALYGAEERWADYPREDLYAWIRNSQALVQAGHPRATELWNEYKSVMTAFQQLTDDDIESVLAYITDVVENPAVSVTSTGVAAGNSESKGVSPMWYWLILGILGLVALLMTRVINNLNKLVAQKEGKTYEGKTMWESITSTGLISFLIFGLVIFAGYTTVNKAVDLGRQKAYAPDQPIKFSHKTHAGLHKIDCQYCHDGARRSKHAVIPATNTCMNCHTAIKNGSEYGTAEITKIYASVGYNPNGNGEYIEGYEEMSADDIAGIYKKWIGDQYKETNGLEKTDDLGDKGEAAVEKEWNHIYESLTNEQKKSLSGSVEWTRIHNLPDHVYFNHAQHVTVGKVECQTCHGQVEEMEVLQQHAPLSMGWCINCHRETAVKFEGNEYYKSYAKYHKELANGEREKVTVEDIGGLECQKCHY